MPDGFDKVAYLRDVAKVVANIRKYGRVASDAAAQGLREGGESIMAVSKELFVPVDTGALRASGHVDGPEQEAEGLVVRLSFGGPAGGKDVGYALYVHENLEARHTIGSAKYLEQPVEQMKGEVVELMANRVNTAIR
jgi:hypothetical protein